MSVIIPQSPFTHHRMPAGDPGAIRPEDRVPVIDPDADTPIHVLPHDGGWIARFERSDAAICVTATKARAVALARTVADERGLRMVVHRKDGTIQRSFNPR